MYALRQNTEMTTCYHKIITYNQITNFHSTYRPLNTVTLIFNKTLTVNVFAKMPHAT